MCWPLALPDVILAIIPYLMLCHLHRPLPTTWPTDVTTMSILKQLATEQINFNMNGYGVEQDVIEVSEDEFTERVRGGGATPLTLPPRLSRGQVTCPAVAPQPAAQIIGIISLTVLDRGVELHATGLDTSTGQTKLPIQVQDLGEHELCMDIIARCL